MIETFDTENMLKMLHSQQGETPFMGGQRISVDVAALLNGLPKVLEALKWYQIAEGITSYTSFGDKTAQPEPVLPKMIRWRDQLIQRTDAELHTVQGGDKQALLAQFGSPEGTAFAEEVIAPRPEAAGGDETPEGGLTPSDDD